MHIQINNKIQRPKLIWFTGLSGAGKTTLSNALHERLKQNGFLSIVLDGDIVRKTINSDLGFSIEDRTENLRRVAEISRLFLDLNIIVLAAFISPLTSDREMIRKIVGDEHYLEVYVNTPLDVCEKRDVKSFYKKARNNEINNFTGISAIYEEPITPDICINTSDLTIETSIDQIYSIFILRSDLL